MQPNYTTAKKQNAVADTKSVTAFVRSSTSFDSSCPPSLDLLDHIPGRVVPDSRHHMLETERQTYFLTPRWRRSCLAARDNPSPVFSPGNVLPR